MDLGDSESPNISTAKMVQYVSVRQVACPMLVLNRAFARGVHITTSKIKNGKTIDQRMPLERSGGLLPSRFAPTRALMR
jgi:hypothetical protein